MESIRYLTDVIIVTNLLFGTMSIFLVAIGKYVSAAWIIFFSIIFSIADGRIARTGNGFTEFNKQFDSLAKLVSFVLAPSILIFTLNREPFFLWRLLVCLIAIFCGAFRLTRFNTEAEDKIALFFNGLPSLGFGATVASIVLIYHKYNLDLEPRIISVIVAILAIAMVSQIRYPTFKDVALFQWKCLLCFAIIFPMLFIIPELTVLVLSLVYIVLMPIKTNLIKR